MELEQKRKGFEKRGLAVAALSYDSVELLAEFARRKGITYPLLSDPESRVIRAFGILNENFPPGHLWRGVPFPGTFIINEKGVVTAKYFEEDHRERYTAGNILTKISPPESRDGWLVTETSHLKLRYTASDPGVRPGNRVRLLLEVELKPKMHVYAPGVQKSYIPIDWQVATSSAWLASPASYPPARTLHLEAIGETVPVYDGLFYLERDLTIGQQNEVRPVLNDKQQLIVEGTFRYQACDDKMCFPPTSVPLKWVFQVERHDPQRAPAELQHRAK